MDERENKAIPPAAGRTPAAASGKPRRPAYRSATFWVMTGLVLAIVLGSWASLRATVEEPAGVAPSRIGDMNRVSLVTGEAALQQMQQMHMGNIGVTDGYIAGYRAASEAVTLWVGTAGTETDSGELLQRMVAAISKGGTPFSTPEPMTLEGRQMYLATGAGGTNYFFQEAHSVVWILVANSSTPAQWLTEVVKNVRFR